MKNVTRNFQKAALVLGLLGGLVAGACDATQLGEVAPGDEADLIKDNDPHLPGSCNNPVACGETPNQNPHGDNPAQCMDCDCMPSPQACHSCEGRCRDQYERCLWNDGPACAEVRDSCLGGCAPRGTVCVCPRP